MGFPSCPPTLSPAPPVSMAHHLNIYFSNPWQSPAPLTEATLSPILLALMVESALYGMHVILFGVCVCIWIQRRQNFGKVKIAMLGAVAVMFVLATLDVGFSWDIALRHTQMLYSGDTSAFVKQVYPKFIIYLINNFIADALLVLRCYVVWDSKKAIPHTAALVLIIGTIFGIISEGTTSPSLKKFIAVYILIVLVLNVVVTILMAGRIFWIAREVKKLMGPNAVSQHHIAVGILVESGLLYTFSALLVLVLSKTNLVLMAATIAIRLVCIMPLLIIVHIGLGQSTKNVQATVSLMQSRTNDEIVLDTVISTMHRDPEDNDSRMTRCQDT